MLFFDKPIASFLWRKNSFHYPELTREMKLWLYDSGSLTQRIIQHCEKHYKHSFKVKVLEQKIVSPESEEIKILGMKTRQRAIIREVLLYCGEQPMVFARTVIPLLTLTGKQRQLNSLGNKPLGAFLFAQKNMHRAPLEISHYQNLWARRSVFYLQNKPLLVYEVFLSDMENV